MHDIEPYYRWRELYLAEEDDRSPFFGKEYSEFFFSDVIYNHVIHPQWDNIGSTTLFLKIIYADYEIGFAIIELMGEWNDTLYNDIQALKRNIIDHLIEEGINQFILIGENVLNFHGSDDSYYEEWFDDIEDGWIVGMGFSDFVVEEMTGYNVDNSVNFSESLEIPNWRTVKPNLLAMRVNELMSRRLGM